MQQLLLQLDESPLADRLWAIASSTGSTRSHLGIVVRGRGWYPRWCMRAVVECDMTQEMNAMGGADHLVTSALTATVLVSRSVEKSTTFVQLF